MGGDGYMIFYFGMELHTGKWCGRVVKQICNLFAGLGRGGMVRGGGMDFVFLMKLQDGTLWLIKIFYVVAVALVNLATHFVRQRPSVDVILAGEGHIRPLVALGYGALRHLCEKQDTNPSIPIFGGDDNALNGNAFWLVMTIFQQLQVIPGVA